MWICSAPLAGLLVEKNSFVVIITATASFFLVSILADN